MTCPRCMNWPPSAPDGVERGTPAGAGCAEPPRQLRSERGATSSASTAPVSWRTCPSTERQLESQVRCAITASPGVLPSTGAPILGFSAAKAGATDLSIPIDGYPAEVIMGQDILIIPPGFGFRQGSQHTR
jgi:hypothetical protein